MVRDRDLHVTLYASGADADFRVIRRILSGVIQKSIDNFRQRTDVDVHQWKGLGNVDDYTMLDQQSLSPFNSRLRYIVQRTPCRFEHEISSLDTRQFYKAADDLIEVKALFVN